MTATVQFELDGQPAWAHEGESILDAAARQGVTIPHLCHKPGYRPDGNCRACVVEIEGERTLAPSCCRTVQPHMKVHAASPRARKSRDLVLELLLSDMPAQGHKWADESGRQPHGELSTWAEHSGVQVRPALAALSRPQPVADTSHPAMDVRLDACIQCNRCVRACREEQMKDVIGMAFRGAQAQVVFDLSDPMGGSSCVGCGECVQACPTGALMPKGQEGDQSVDRKVDSVCPYCGVGCQLTYFVKDERIVRVEGRDGPANQERLCVKGRFGFDYVHNPDRLTRPLIRRPGAPKDPARIGRHMDWREVFREATWDEALAVSAGALKALRAQHGPKILGWFWLSQRQQ